MTDDKKFLEEREARVEFLEKLVAPMRSKRDRDEFKHLFVLEIEHMLGGMHERPDIEGEIVSLIDRLKGKYPGEL